MPDLQARRCWLIDSVLCLHCWGFVASLASAFRLLAVASSAALLELDAWTPLASGVVSALLAASLTAEELFALSVAWLCSAVVAATLLASPAKAKPGVRAVARAIAVSSARARFAMP